MRLKFKRSLKPTFTKYVNEGRVWGFPAETYFTVSIHNGMGDMGFTKSYSYGARIKIPRDISSRLTEEEKELVGAMRKHIATKIAASPSEESDGSQQTISQ
jgi:hypothetical protein